MARPQKAIRIAEEHGLAPYHQARAHFWLALAVYRDDRWDLTLDSVYRSYRYALEAESPEMTATSLTLIAEVEYQRGRFEEAILRMAEAVRACDRYGNAFRLFWAVKNLGEAHLDAGDATSALVHLRRARTLAYGIQNVYYSVWTGLLLALAHALSGQREEALRYLRTSLEEMAPDSYAPIGEERRLFLGVLVVLATDARVRREMFIAVRRYDGGYPSAPAKRRHEILRIAAGIIPEEVVRSTSLIDDVPCRDLFKQTGWLEPDAYEKMLKGGGSDKSLSL